MVKIPSRSGDRNFAPSAATAASLLKIKRISSEQNMPITAMTPETIAAIRRECARITGILSKFFEP